MCIKVGSIGGNDISYRFPGQENGDFKIPSVLWYTQQGRVRAAGAEAFDPAMYLIAEATALTFVEW